MVVGFSIGGWIAAELAVRDTTRLGSIVLVDAVGIQVEGHAIADVFPLTPDELSALSFHNPAAFRLDPATLSPDQVAARAANFQALGVYGRESGMRDPKLRRRLGRAARAPAHTRVGVRRQHHCCATGRRIVRGTLTHNEALKRCESLRVIDAHPSESRSIHSGCDRMAHHAFGMLAGLGLLATNDISLRNSCAFGTPCSTVYRGKPSRFAPYPRVSPRTGAPNRPLHSSPLAGTPSRSSS